MDYAKDYNERVISAESPDAITGRRYTCLSCKRQVTLRAKGSFFTRPYFAHLPGVANTATCKHYVKSIYTPFPPNPATEYFPSHRVATRIIGSEAFSPTQNIYISNKGDMWELNLVLKPNQWQRQDSGYILIKGVLGDIRIGHNEIRNADGKKISIKIGFNFSTDSIKQVGTVDKGLWRQLTDQSCTLNPLDAIYTSSDATGRKLGPGERLRKGEDYIYVSGSKVQQPTFIEASSESIEWGDVYIYKFNVPFDLESYKQSELESFFKRSIVDQPPKFFISGVYPLDLDIDGAYIIPKSTNHFFIRTDGELDVKSLKRYVERSVNGNQTKYEVADLDDFMIIWKNYPLIRFEKGTPREKVVDGIKILHGGKELDPLNSYNHLIKSSEVIDFPDEIFDKITPKVTVDGIKSVLHRGERLDKTYKNLIIDADCFGYIDTYQEGNHYLEKQAHVEQSPDLNWMKFMGFSLSPYERGVGDIFSAKPFIKQRQFHSRKLKKSGD